MMMMAVWLSLVYKLFSSSQNHKKRRISLQKLRTNVYFEIQHIIEFSVHLRFFHPPSPPLQLIFPRQFLKRVVGFTSKNEQGSGTLPHPEHQTFFFPTNDGALSSFTCSDFIFFFTFFFLYRERGGRERESSQQRPPEDTYTQLVLCIETREARQTDIIIIPI